VLLVYATDQIGAFFRERALILNGKPAHAVITHMDPDLHMMGQHGPPDSPCDLDVTMDGTSEKFQLSGVTLTGQDQDLAIGQIIQLRVDPQDSSVWTDATTPEPLGRRLAAGLVVLVALAATVATCVFLRKRAIHSWQDDRALEFAVVSSSRSALAPLSHQVRCEPVGIGRDPRIVTVYLPGRFAKPAPGEVLWLMHPPGKPLASIAAAAYE
jgi:hypothetical protein